jgi:hypothetical protein
MSDNAQINVRVESHLVNKEVDTNYIVKLPEYKTEIIIREQHVNDLIEKLTLLKNKKND